MSRFPIGACKPIARDRGCFCWAAERTCFKDIVQERACASTGATELISSGGRGKSGRRRRRREKGERERERERESLWGATTPHCDSQSALQMRAEAIDVRFSRGTGIKQLQGRLGGRGVGLFNMENALCCAVLRCTAAQLGVVDDEWA